MSQLIRDHIWRYWHSLPKDVLVYVWNRLSVKEIKDIVKLYLPNLQGDKDQIIKQLLDHFFNKSEEN